MPTALVGLGAYMPDNIIGNDFWSAETVDAWRSSTAWSPDRAQRALAEAEGPGAQRVLAAMAEVADDPFQGAVERRYLPDGMSAVDMELEAALAALKDAGMQPRDVDFLLGSALVPDLLHAADVCSLHTRLGLRPECLTLNVDGVCNSFQLQLAVADGLLQSGQGRLGLLVQSSAASRTTPRERPFSVHFGDGATAEVVTTTGGEEGLVGQAHRTDGSIHRAMVLGVEGEGGAWWVDGPTVSLPLDRDQARRMLLTFADVGAELLGGLFEEAGVTPLEVAFFAGHQATSWWRKVVQEHVGMSRARSVDTYPWAGTLSAANLPLILHTARSQGLLHDGDLVAFYQGGTGATYSASLYRWGGAIATPRSGHGP